MILALLNVLLALLFCSAIAYIIYHELKRRKRNQSYWDMLQEQREKEQVHQEKRKSS
jgi:hypothetical protein